MLVAWWCTSFGELGSWVGGEEEEREGGEKREGKKKRKGEVGAAPSPAASDPVRISAPPAAGWIQPVVGGGKEREVGVGVGKC